MYGKWVNLEYIYDIFLSAGIYILFSILNWCLCVVINGFECVLSKLSLVIFKGIIYLARHVKSIEATFNHAEIKTPLRLGNVYFEILDENQKYSETTPNLNRKHEIQYFKFVEATYQKSIPV